MSALLGQPFFDLLADTLKQHAIFLGQFEVGRINPSQNGTKLNQRSPEFPVHGALPCNGRATPAT